MVALQRSLQWVCFTSQNTDSMFSGIEMLQWMDSYTELTILSASENRAEGCSHSVTPDDPWECSTCRRDFGRAEPCAVLTCPLPLKWRQLGAVASHCFVDGGNAAAFSELWKESKRDMQQHTHKVMLPSHTMNTILISTTCLYTNPIEL